MSKSYVDEHFFSHFDFWDEQPDPTHGSVEYLGKDAAFSHGLANASHDRVYMGADMLNVASMRPSVRVTSKAQFNEGLFIISLDHIPTGCGTWPAFWMYGADAEHVWPTWGELDIIEGAHKSTVSSSTLHTTEGCDQSALQPGTDFNGTWNAGQSESHPASNCDVNAEGQWTNQGCGQAAPEGSMGATFNGVGGGTFAVEWDPVNGYIRLWFWRSDAVPEDIAEGSPRPEAWGMPYSFFRLAEDVCPAKHFQNMRIVFDLTFCGDLGTPTFADGCPEHAQMPCNVFVEHNPEAMKEAYWSIRALTVYHKNASIV